MALLSDRYTSISRELIQSEVQIDQLLKSLQESQALSPAEVAALEGYSKSDTLRGWRNTLSLLATKKKGRPLLDYLQSLPEASACLSSTIRHLKQLWMEGEKKVAIFISSHQYELHFNDAPNKLELPKSHVSNTVTLKNAMQRLGYVIKEVNMSMKAPSDQREKDLAELVLNIQENADVFVCISGVVTEFRMENFDCGILLYNDAVLTIPPMNFKPVGLSIPGISRILSTLPPCSITLYIDCIAFQIPQQFQMSIWDQLTGARYLRSGNSRSQTVCGYVTVYQYDLEQYCNARFGPQRQRWGDWLSFAEGMFFAFMKLFGQNLLEWTERKEPRISNREFYEMLIFNFAAEVRSNTPFFHPTVYLMGDKDRCFLGQEILPHRRWFHTRTVSSSQLQSGESVLVVKLDTSSLFRMRKGLAVVVYHPRFPDVKAEGNIQSGLGPFHSEISISDVKLDKVKFLKELLKKFSQIPFGPVLCVCPIIRPRFTVIIAKSAQDDKKEEIEDLMKIIQNQSLTLECAVRDIDAQANDWQQGEYFLVHYNKLHQCLVVRNLCRLLMDFYEQGVREVVRILEQCSHFHLGMELSQVRIPQYKYSCILIKHDIPLLCQQPSAAEVTFSMSASSEKGDGNRASDGVLYTENSSGVWKPRLGRDLDQYLQCNVDCNVNVNAIEIKGDSEAEEYVTKLQLTYLRFTKASDQVVLTRDQPNITLQLSSEDMNGHRLTYVAVRHVEIDPTQWSAPHATLKLRLLKVKDVPVSSIQVIGADKLIVDPEKARRSTELEDGVLVLIAAPNQPDHKITLDFKKEIQLAKIELTATFTQTGSDAIQASISYFSEMSRLELKGNSSIWSQVITLEHPITGCQFRLAPKDFQKQIALQVQLYGSPVCSTGNPLCLKEDSHMQLHLSVPKGPHNVYFYVLLFEYTGSVSLLYKECLLADRHAMKMLRVFIPKSIPDNVTSIVDTYRIFSSTKELNLQFLLQQGPTDYYHCSSTKLPPSFQPHEITDKEWDVIDLPVRIERRLK